MTDIAQPSLSTMAALKARLATPWTVTLGIPLLVLLFDAPNFTTIISFATRAVLGTLPYIVLAVTLIAGLKAAGAEAMIAKAFKGKEVRMVFLAATFGGLAPFCSCEVIPFIAGLLALGAPLSAVMAFWLSSPLIDPPTLLITAAALGWPFAIGKAVSAVMLGIFGGFAIVLLAKTNWISNPLREYRSTGCCGTQISGNQPVWTFWQDPRRVEIFRSEFIINALFLIKWLALAYVLEAMLVSYIPAELIAQAVGGEGVVPIVTAALVGMPAYLNSYVAPPLLAGLMTQGMTEGAAMAFMVAGAVSSIPAMAAVWSLVRKRVFALYLGLGITGAVGSGLIFQAVV